MKNKNVVIISSIDWSTHWQMHHQLATSIVDTGNRVLFVENTGARAPRLADIGRMRERIVNWVKSVRGFREVQPGLTVFSPLFLPFHTLALRVPSIDLSSPDRSSSGFGQRIFTIRLSLLFCQLRLHRL